LQRDSAMSRLDPCFSGAAVKLLFSGYGLGYRLAYLDQIRLKILIRLLQHYLGIFHLAHQGVEHSLE